MTQIAKIIKPLLCPSLQEPHYLNSWDTEIVNCSDMETMVEGLSCSCEDFDSFVSYLTIASAAALLLLLLLIMLLLAALCCMKRKIRKLKSGVLNITQEDCVAAESNVGNDIALKSVGNAHLETEIETCTEPGTIASGPSSSEQAGKDHTSQTQTAVEEPKVVVKKAAPYCPYEDVEDFQSAPKASVIPEPIEDEAGPDDLYDKTQHVIDRARMNSKANNALLKTVPQEDYSTIGDVFKTKDTKIQDTEKAEGGGTNEIHFTSNEAPAASGNPALITASQSQTGSEKHAPPPPVYSVVNRAPKSSAKDPKFILELADTSTTENTVHDNMDNMDIDSMPSPPPIPPRTYDNDKADDTVLENSANGVSKTSKMDDNDSSDEVQGFMVTSPSDLEELVEGLATELFPNGVENEGREGGISGGEQQLGNIAVEKVQNNAYSLHSYETVEI